MPRRSLPNCVKIQGHVAVRGAIKYENYENKYEFPPPVDNTLFFGNCILINKDEEDMPINITKKEWTEIYDHLYGGFDDIGEDDVRDGILGAIKETDLIPLNIHM